MSGYKRDLAKVAMVLLLVALIGGVTYYLFPQTLFEPQPRLAFSFLFGQGNIASTDSMGKSETVYLEVLEIGFDFANGSTTFLPEGNLLAQDLSDIYPDKYSGEVVASSLQRIRVKVTPCYAVASDVDYTLDAMRNSTIHASLKGEEVVDLGVFERANYIEKYVGYSSNRSAIVHCYSVDLSSSGYWSRESITPELGIDVAELSVVLAGSGTTLITFDAMHSVHLKYNIKSTGGTEQGETDLSWEGRMGTFEIVYAQGRITRIRYEFTTVKLLLLIA
ncbi:MAG: hypothetical protein OEZ21_08620 [Candidatus Bathyarchaeota archaeon]|nr:hypothetical protein [Candidatus Bathyarchaeota archaeon]MDH5747001.1 hypothetical protein [Candidatus Bathyarchaeota archaeon]